MRSRVQIFLFLAIGIFANGTSIFALITAPKSFAEISPDGSRILVMLHPSARGDVAEPMALPGGRFVELRKQFPTSGIYDLKHFHRIAEIDWFVKPDALIWNDDFSSIVALNEFDANYPSEWALAFVKDGKVIKSYRSDELLTAFQNTRWLPYRTWNYFYDWHDYTSFEKTGSLVRVATAKRRLYSTRGDSEIGFQEFYEFDFETGEMLSQRIENTKFKTIVSLIGIFIALIVGSCIWIGKILWKRRFPEPSRA